MDLAGLADLVAAGAPLALAAVAAVGGVLTTWGLFVLRQLSPVEQRLGRHVAAANAPGESDAQGSFGERVLRPLVGACSRVVLRWTPAATLESYRHKLVLAGGGGPGVRDFLGIKGLLALGLVAAYLALAGVVGWAPSLLPPLVLAAVGYYLPNVLLQRRVKARQHRIQRGLPDALDLLTICVEAGLGFDGALGRVAEKRGDELSREFGRALTELRIGRSRREALRALAARTDVPDVNTFVSAIVQSEQLGVSISRVLTSQSVQMRVRRRQRAEEQAHKAAVKMLFPMVFLIFPAVFIVILGPAIPGIVKALT